MISVCQQMYLAQCPSKMSNIAHAFLDIVAAACAPHLEMPSESRTSGARRALCVDTSNVICGIPN